MAKNRLLGIERKMKNNEQFAAAYKAILRAYVDKGYASKLPPSEAAVQTPRTWYLPHFGVVNANKPGKLRLVFDAAAKVDGVSLNSHLLKGPQQYQSMPSVLFNFRVGAVAVCADIKKMFHQVLARPEDRCSQRFLWRDGDSTRPIDVYEMNVMTFGAACSPCVAQHVKTVNAEAHRAYDPRAIEAILQHHYADDFVDSFDSVGGAVDIARQVSLIHSDAGFELRNFRSNLSEVVEVLEGSPAQLKDLYENGLLTEKILGMFWQPCSDAFRYKLEFHNTDAAVISGEKRPAKRQLLSIAMSVFDPLGFLGNFTIVTKLIMRETWRHDVGWDQPLPDHICAAWDRWRQDLQKVVNLQIPRHYFSKGSPKELQFHTFVDASEEAFAAVSYWRSVNEDGNVEVAFVCAKTRCAPLKMMTVPRLELQAAVLGVRLMQSVLEERNLRVTRRIFWSDSKTVLKWIASKHRRYKPFVAHRIAEILAATEVSEWRWIPTAANIADEATRAKHRVVLEPSSRWLKGAEFMRKGEEFWPSQIVDVNECSEGQEEELRSNFSLLAVSCSMIRFDRFSSFRRLRRAIAWVVWFVNRCRKLHNERETACLTVAELSAAESILYRQAQFEAYYDEITQIRNHGCLKKGNELFTLFPYIDAEGILRVSGRIDAASWLPYDSRRPIILSPNHPLAKLVVHHHHCLMKHQNHEATVCEVRRRFWIPRLRRLVRKVTAECNVCKLARATPAQPIMGPLPEDRCKPFVRPFSYVGLDYFGPLTVTIGRRTKKRWVALFTCLTVHLEVAADLSTDACILVLRNFVNRRGIPVRIRSDNGKNFVGVEQETRRFADVFDCARLQDEASSKGIEWLFNCPCNSSEGGVWERMVRFVKCVLRHTLKEVAPREHTLQSFLIEAENIVNSRPLTHLPISPEQEEPLTPNHFLLGAPSTAQTPGKGEAEEARVLRKQWRIARQLRTAFWRRWVEEYLPTLTRRVKWCKPATPLKDGDMVFICDQNMPRTQWSRGRILRVYPGADAVVRSADVQTKNGILRRPASKLAVLYVDNSDSSQSIHGGGGVEERPS